MADGSRLDENFTLLTFLNCISGLFFMYLLVWASMVNMAKGSTQHQMLFSGFNVS